MPSKKKKYNARFPAGRIKKIMQTDEEVGKVAQAVPVIISRTLELFVESLLTKTLRITNARNAKTLSPSHMKQCIISESRFDFLRDLVKNIPDIAVNEDQLSGSESGYGAETITHPSSTPGASVSASSSSSNGGGAAVLSLVTHSDTNPSLGVHKYSRSESFSQASGGSYADALPIANHQRRTATSQAYHNATTTSSLQKRPPNSLNFYKEISPEDSGGGVGSVHMASSREPPPPKLSRVNSAPASSNVSIPFKIDILSELPASTSSSRGLVGAQQPATSKTATAATNNYNITYQIGSPATGKHEDQQPVIKLDYSNVKLPMTVSGEPTKLGASSSQLRDQQQPQPTIKIDLSNITNFNATAALAVKSSGPMVSESGVDNASNTHVPSTPSTPLSALSSGSASCSSLSSTTMSGSNSRNPYTFQVSTQQQHSTSSSPSTSASSTVAVPGVTGISSSISAPLYSSISSTIPGMDEDYDDI